MTRSQMKILIDRNSLSLLCDTNSHMCMNMIVFTKCDRASEKGPSGHKIHHITKWHIS